MDDDKVYVKLQGHWIIEMSEMLATSNAKSIDPLHQENDAGRSVFEVVHPIPDCSAHPESGGNSFRRKNRIWNFDRHLILKEIGCLLCFGR
mgnify:CR=1 FL=1